MKTDNGKSRPELLAPAGSLEKMKIAFEFGADAVYFGLPDFSLRVRINQFDKDGIKKAAEYCRKKKKKFYVTLNIYAHQQHLKKLPEHLGLIKEIKPDGVIVSDPGILNVIKRELPKQEIHLSTQANATNSEAVKFWADQGVRRIILAREVTLEEIREIRQKTSGVELECFVHGAMCMSYSGRCILSKWMAGRGANLGDCAQPCRWLYRNADLRVKEMRVIDDQSRFEVGLEEDEHGTYFFNSRDLCLIEHLKELKGAGIDSFKIEGRAKSVYYVALAVRAYRKVLDAISNKDLSEEEADKIVTDQKAELLKLSNRGYTKGFLLGKEPEHLFDKAAIDSGWSFVGISDEETSSARRSVFVHNKIQVGDEVEIITPKGDIKMEVLAILDEEGEVLDSAHGGQGKKFRVEFSGKISGVFLLRAKR